MITAEGQWKKNASKKCTQGQYYICSAVFVMVLVLFCDIFELFPTKKENTLEKLKKISKMDQDHDKHCSNSTEFTKLVKQK